MHLELLKSLQTGALASVSVAVPLLPGCWLKDCAGEGQKTVLRVVAGLTTMNTWETAWLTVSCKWGNAFEPQV